MNLRERLPALTELLQQYGYLWRPQPFVEPVLGWQATHPELATWLDGLSDAEVGDLALPWLDRAPLWLQQVAQRARDLAALPDLALGPPRPLGADASRRIPGRKVRQIEGFCRAVQPRLPREPALVDWCAGKSHLGRQLARLSGGTLLALERDAVLVQAGQAECDHLGLRARFVQANVLGPTTAEILSHDQWLVALHACGDLHAALLAAAVARGVAGVALAPCCYNLTRGELARSTRGRLQQLELTQTDLDLLHREPLVAAGSDLVRAQQEQAWRLGFDELQRTVTGSGTYRTMPPFPRPWLRLPFAQFCQQFAALDGLELPRDCTWSHHEAAGWRRLAQVQRRELVRGLFRAPLEAWLVLDRAQALAEAGYRVQVGTFCAREVTPRNLLILAERRGPEQ